jgi:hypothetical protein
MALTAVLAGLVLVVPPPRPVVVPSSNVASASPRELSRRDRGIRGGLIASAVTVGVGIVVLCAVSLPASSAYQREIERADRAWSFDEQRAHLDRARVHWRVARAGALIGAPMLAVGTVSTVVFASLYNRLVARWRVAPRR